MLEKQISVTSATSTASTYVTLLDDLVRGTADKGGKDLQDDDSIANVLNRTYIKNVFREDNIHRYNYVKTSNTAYSPY